MATIYQPRHEQRRQPEMLQKAHLHETFFSMKGVKERPVSVATEFMESDFDDDEILSEIDDGENSPRASVNSSGQPSFTTVSSYDEVHTPRSSRAPTAFQFDLQAKPVEGPRGPHLFRSSTLSVHSAEFQNALSLSPVTPRTARPDQTEFHLPIALDLTSLPTPRRRQSGPFQFTDEELDTTTLAEWSPEKVAQWMLNAGVELQISEKFVENDITGGILITLKFEDLKELGIPSFGARTKVWDEIHVMRNIQPSEPAPETPIEDEPDREVRREQRRMDGDDNKPRRKKSKAEDIISPLESVSIVGIEQMMPKPHHCSKGENCSKWKRNQKMLEAFKKDHPFVDMDKGGIIMVAGDPGNAATAGAINKQQDDFFRPVSDAIPSVVASSDILGPGGLPPLQYLQEATLRNLQSRDPQDNVRQFLDFQHAHIFESSEVPPTPPFEIVPTPQPPHQALRSLPRLSIPATARNTPQPAYNQPCSATAHPDDEEEQLTPTGVYRFGTPFSEMDVPVTAVPLGPVARDASQSVPPDMNYRTGPVAPISRSVSRATARRPSFPVMPSLDENRVAAAVVPPRRQSPQSLNRKQGQRQLQPPPRMQYPWTSERPAEKAIPPVPSSATSSSLASATTPFSSSSARFSPGFGSTSPGSTSPRIKDAEGVTYAGPMRKRRTKMLRHEWQEHFFTLRGTRLNMHKDEAGAMRERTLEYIDIDDYAIACSSLASSNKLSAKFKAMGIRRGSDDKQDVAAFSFQLVPQDARGGVKLRKRESVLPSSAAASAAGPEGAANGTGKSHYFAVKNRDERIDWMRELMLAKALKQKGEGFEVSVNGNMI